MSRPAAPSMPTEKQIREAHAIVDSLHPGAKIARIGPDGISFDYGDAPAANSNQWTGVPFAAGGRNAKA